MRYALLVLLVGLMAFTGCGKKEEEVKQPEVQAPPPPTPEQIQAEIMPVVQPMLNAVQAKKYLSQADRDQVVGNLRNMKGKHSGTDNGRIALGRVATAVEGAVRQARDQGQWGIVIGAIQAVDVLKPGAAADRYATLMKRAELMIARPKVEVTGFVGVDNDVYVFARVTDETTKKTEMFKVREGEEFYEPEDPATKQKKPAILKLVRVIGDSQAAEFLYIPANDAWEVKGPSAR